MCVFVYTRPQISKFNGVPWDLYKNDDEAIAATDWMIAQNRIKNPGIDAALDQLSDVCPALTSKFFYIHREGVN